MHAFLTGLSGLTWATNQVNWPAVMFGYCSTSKPQIGNGLVAQSKMLLATAAFACRLDTY